MSKKPPQCKECPSWHNAGHPKGSRYYGTGYNNWCCKFSKPAYKAVGECRLRSYINENKQVEEN